MKILRNNFKPTEWPKIVECLVCMSVLEITDKDVYDDLGDYVVRCPCCSARTGYRVLKTPASVMIPPSIPL